MTHPTYLLIGTVTKDAQSDGRYTVGGTTTYAATLVQSFGWSCRIITRAASDFTPPVHLAGVEWHILPAQETTTFRNEYHGEARTQTLEALAPPLTLMDIQDKHHPADLIHFCPLAQDVDPAILTLFSDKYRLATPQGWLRHWDEQGQISLGSWSEAPKVLPQLDAVVISLEDIQEDWVVAEQWASFANLLVVTQGAEGCTLFFQGQRRSVPPRPTTPTHLTGAGDIFAAAFAIQHYQTGDPWYSARFANVAASLAIERYHPDDVPTLAEIEAYLD